MIKKAVSDRMKREIYRDLSKYHKVDFENKSFDDLNEGQKALLHNRARVVQFKKRKSQGTTLAEQFFNHLATAADRAGWSIK
ncbi:hypothetical protein [Croceimicrobium sp.]|uniref:hypothetical protein n=1 Tax=Croceimicrobium sp. TaxID=2828340 RepID=UPI003BAC5AA1